MPDTNETTMTETSAYDSDLYATYSPEDNKLRLYSVTGTKLGTELYARVRAAGFIWAPQQKLFVAPAWTPSRADLLTELCGEIGDEDTTLVDRQEQRAERFEDYSANRKQDAEEAHAAVERITSGIPLGQPILVGHHSEKRARKDAERIENGMRKAVKMWETANYWKSRAAGAIRHAKYKELPAVRARRIKGLEADQRKEQRTKTEAERIIKFWLGECHFKGGEPIPVTRENALKFCNYYDHTSKEFTLAEYPRNPPASQYQGSMTLWSALGGSDGEDYAIITVEQAREISLRCHRRTVASCERWLGHLANRLEYEKTMLEDSGASDLLKPKPRPTHLPLVNYRAPSGLDIQNIYRGTGNDVLHYPQVEMTQAEYAAISNDYKSTRVVGNSHRVRTAMQPGYKLVCVFLTDSKVHPIPAAVDKATRGVDEPKHWPAPLVPEPIPDAVDAAKFEGLKDSLRAGVKVVSAPQLFPTPPDIARQMARAAADGKGTIAGLRVLEPSAGTGNLIRAAINNATGMECGLRIVAVERNLTLVEGLRQQRELTLYANESNFDVREGDFLECNGDLGKFDRVLMNPPFENGSDIKHIRHAMGFLKPGGMLVALCANGPRQQRELMPMADTWEELPEGSFKDQGTGVRVAMMTVRG